MYRTPKKKSWISRVFDTVRLKEEDTYDAEAPEEGYETIDYTDTLSEEEEVVDHYPEDLPEPEGELGVDMYQTNHAIVIQAITAGVKLNDIDIDVTREHVAIRGTRTPNHRAHEDDFYNQEIYWGPFSREITLPFEVDIDQAEAVEDHGLLTITLPKLNKDRRAALKVKSL